MTQDNRETGEHVDKDTAKGKGAGGFSPDPKKEPKEDHKDGFQGESRAAEEARRVTPAGKARSK